MCTWTPTNLMSPPNTCPPVAAIHGIMMNITVMGPKFPNKDHFFDNRGLNWYLNRYNTNTHNVPRSMVCQDPLPSYNYVCLYCMCVCIYLCMYSTFEGNTRNTYGLYVRLSYQVHHVVRTRSTCSTCTLVLLVLKLEYICRLVC